MIAEISYSLNGDAKTAREPITIAQLLIAENLQQRRVAVERNGEIVTRHQHASTLIAAGDRIEIVHAIGGG
jgi:sulfur carrier protein